MLSFLFPRLTPSVSRGGALFGALVAEARKPHWFVGGRIPDSLDGRFALMATVIALATVRLERGSESARMEAVGLAERFVEAMDAEHRQLGLGDPTLGKTVRKLVASLARRMELWRQAIESGEGWSDAVQSSLYRDVPAVDASAHSLAALNAFWARLEAAPDEALIQGVIE